MARQPEAIIITLENTEVGIRYQAATPEAELGDESAAVELGLHALARHAIALRERLGRPVPEVLTRLVQAETWRDSL